MLTLYITRHGETIWNTERRMKGWADSPLTKKGIKNAASLGGRMKQINLDAIYASSSKRTEETANLIRGDRDTPIILNDDLKEINMGEWEGKRFLQSRGNYPEAFHSFWNTPHLYKPVGGESFEQLKDRVLKAMNFIQEEHTSGNVLVVTHSVVIKTLLAFFKNSPLENIWDPPYIHDTSLTVVELGEGKSNIVIEGDISHRNEQM
ncbi:histidine phosphatase family protein [Bacillus carboniphilus]|uniref:Histidine phosphatase family protein n=1 Tax=Bacillus carboniphilus TaxID=86663 RepID=A0ABY9JWB4_9BACI|nr:histidine phosphatase family protein [Bacillus carboniphilus]WLR42558.1 histidine phosphatase family protein [Bacillus carboniphilus]